jgi:large subunit ribosomal protein L5e
MTFVKVVKNKAYFKRFQVKPRRRREGKTDYQARRALILMDKTKYNTPKYRLVVRFTNTDVICQIVSARIEGDHVVAAAYAHELPRYGIKVGLTNYAAAYATGLLLARRTLTLLGLADAYQGKVEADGELYEVEPEGETRPFRAVLDVGLVHTTTGHRVFGAMKGAIDGGIDIPHTEKRFPKYRKDTGFDPEELKARIYGTHVAAYMRQLQEEDPEKYQRQFSRYIKAGIDPDQVEDMYREAHRRIREDPRPSLTDKSKVVKRPRKTPRLSREERQARLAARLASLARSSAEEPMATVA